MADNDTELDRWPTQERDTLVAAPPPPPATTVGPPPPEPGPDRRIGAGMLLALAAILLVLAGVAIAYFLTHRDSSPNVTTVVVQSSTAATAKVAVPRVVGLNEQAALDRLTQLGLGAKVERKTGGQGTGLVRSQEPSESTQVAKGSQVTLVVDSAKPTIAVPDLQGSQLGAARAALKKLGLDVATTEVTSDEQAGTVVDQAPEANAKLAKGSVVTLSIARGSDTTSTPSSTSTATPTTSTSAAAPAQPENATMPDVSGKKEQAAAQAMSTAGILPSLVFVPGQDPLGTVVEQAKPSGTTVAYHAHVQINISSGPGDKPKIDVPNVVGQTLQQAVSTLNGAHLRLIFVKLPVGSRSLAGKIVQQSPLGNGQAPQNAQVLVFLGAYRG